MAVKTDGPIILDRLAGWLLHDQAAEFLGVTPDYVYRLTKMRLLRYYVIGRERGGTRLYRVADIEGYAASHPYLGTRRATEATA